jgi:hypothetical protein
LRQRQVVITTGKGGEHGDTVFPHNLVREKMRGVRCVGS